MFQTAVDSPRKEKEHPQVFYFPDVYIAQARGRPYVPPLKFLQSGHVESILLAALRKYRVPVPDTPPPSPIIAASQLSLSKAEETSSQKSHTEYKPRPLPLRIYQDGANSS